MVRMRNIGGALDASNFGSIEPTIQSAAGVSVEQDGC